MAVDFTYSARESYRDYLGRIYVRQKIDVVLSKRVRAAIGSVAELFTREAVPQGAISDYQYGGPDDQHEVLTLQLSHVCARLGPLAGNIAAGFQAMFDDAAPMPLPDGLPAAILPMVADHRYDEALAALGQDDAGDDFRIHQLRAMLLAGIPGQPKSAGILDLPAAERAYASAARKAEPRPIEAACALVAAGRCAYADGRFRDAKRYFVLALARDPNSGEANYQMARLRMHAGSARGVRNYLVRSFRAGFSYALRAAGDQLFQQASDLVASCVAAATKQIAADSRRRIGRYAGQLAALARDGDPQWGLDRLERLPELLRQFEALKAEPEPATLKRALHRHARVLACEAPLRRLARDYCVLLRKAETAVAARGVATPAPPDDAARATRLCDIAESALAAIAAVATLASLIAVHHGPNDWSIGAAVVSLVLLAGALALRCEPPARADLRWFVERRLLRPRSKRRAEYDVRRRRQLIDDNRAGHRARIARISARFGLDPA